MDTAQEVLHLHLSLVQNLERCKFDVLIKIVSSYRYRSSLGHQLTLTQATVDREALILYLFSKLLLCLGSLRLFQHVGKHLVHKLVACFKVFFRV